MFFFSCQEKGEMQPPPVVVVKDTVMTFNVNLVYNKDYAPVEQKIDSVGVCRFLGISKLQFRSYLKADNSGKVKYYAINPDLTIDETASTADAPGHWFVTSGSAGKWGADAKLYSNYGENEWAFFIGSHPDNTAKGQSYTVRQAFWYAFDELTHMRAIFVFKVTLI
jgi:hypothetical protein